MNVKGLVCHSANRFRTTSILMRHTMPTCTANRLDDVNRITLALHAAIQHKMTFMPMATQRVREEEEEAERRGRDPIAIEGNAVTTKRFVFDFKPDR